MKTVIVGHQGALSRQIGIRLIKEQHKVAYVGINTEEKTLNKKANHFNIPINSGLLRDVFESMRFNVVIFIHGEKDSDSNLLKSLNHLFECAVATNVEHYVYISTTDVYDSNSDLATEEDTPVPTDYKSISAYLGEEYFEFMKKKNNISYTVLRVSALYDTEHFEGTFFGDIADSAQINSYVDLPNPTLKKDFINTGDVADALFRVIANKKEGLYNIASGKATDFAMVEATLREALPNVEVKHSEKTPPGANNISIKHAIKILDWMPLHDMYSDYKEITKNLSVFAKSKVRKSTLLSRLFGVRATEDNEFSVAQIMLSAKYYMEIVVVFGLFLILQFFLENVLATEIFFDTWLIRLAFVVLIGSIYGFKFGVFAALITTVVYSIGFVVDGRHILDLVYNINYWIPVAIYFLVGAITGFARDNYIREIDFLNAEKAVIVEKNEFMYRMFSQVKDIKKSLEENFATYEGNMGKVYSIERKLTSLNPDDLYNAGVEILEDIFETKKVAIYDSFSDENILSLSVSSRGLLLQSSISKYEVNYIVLPDFENIGMYVNTELNPDNPSFCGSIYFEDSPQIFIMLWDVTFDQFSHYHINLFKLVSLYIANALEKAYKYKALECAKQVLEG